MLDVFFTVDVEIWCDGWLGIDQKFPSAFRKYVYGSTPEGDFGLPFQLDVMRQHGIHGVFFVEPLFSTHFGAQPLADMVGLIQDSSQEVQLHLHTEWVDEAREPLLPEVHGKRQHLRYFSRAEQTALIAAGAKLLRAAGVARLDAFRAGSFAFNIETLSALAENHIPFDSSYNASMFGLDSGVMPGVNVVEPLDCCATHEYPMTVFDDGRRALRHVQLTACSYEEMERLLWQALDVGRSAFVILSHSFELLSPSMARPDKVVVKRFRKLCTFLDRNRDCFNVRGFRDLVARTGGPQPAPLTSPRWLTAARMIEQASRSRYR